MRLITRFTIRKAMTLPSSSKLAFTFAILMWASLAVAQEEARPNYAYIALEPEIVTNYAGDNAKKLGYLRVSIEMMLEDPSKIPDLEHHMPRLRAKVIEVIGSQSEQQVRSMTGREEMRRLILTNFKDILIQETGDDIVKDIIFTKYLRQGG